jgi:hypothetical protein
MVVQVELELHQVPEVSHQVVSQAVHQEVHLLMTTQGMYYKILIIYIFVLILY